MVGWGPFESSVCRVSVVLVWSLSALEHWGPVCGPVPVDPEGQHPVLVDPLDQQVGWDQPD